MFSSSDSVRSQYCFYNLSPASHIHVPFPDTQSDTGFPADTDGSGIPSVPSAYAPFHTSYRM